MQYRFKHKDKIAALTDGLLNSYTHTPTGMEHIDFAELPSRSEMVKLVDGLMTLLFPGYFGPKRPDRENLPFFTGARLDSIYEILAVQIFMGLRHRCRGDRNNCGNCETLAEDITCDFLKKLPSIRELLATDVEAAWRGDPAAKSYDEIIYCYPGLFAISLFRMANVLHKAGSLILPRFMTEYAHSQTGCDIHPGATIGEAFFIDHATGVVIGETSVIGKNVRIYQGVTLGSLRFPKDEDGNLLRDLKRHPTIEDDVVVYAGATILGGETTIGKGAVIGGNTWITSSVQPGKKVILK